ncbi:DoxX family protein [Maribacter sp. 2307ULW6-5]|uniref:DoxX family protein n=1 Tax=Maribacter sp. 2307ULW6-5 TaxID=3386275 RepID=UPI0039BD318D
MHAKDKKITTTVTVLRILIGWHFLYEGVVKLYDPSWTAYGYLASAQGPFKPLFNLMLGDGVLPWINNLNMAALVIVGITLLFGLYERVGALVGIGLLAMYYLAHPSFPGLPQVNVEGNYWFVNKNLIEMVACILLFLYPTGQYFGLAVFQKKKAVETVQG